MTDTERLQIAVGALKRIARNRVMYHNLVEPAICLCSVCIAKDALEQMRPAGTEQTKAPTLERELGVKHG